MTQEFAEKIHKLSDDIKCIQRKISGQEKHLEDIKNLKKSLDKDNAYLSPEITSVMFLSCHDRNIYIRLYNSEVYAFIEILLTLHTNKLDSIKHELETKDIELIELTGELK